MLCFNGLGCIDLQNILSAILCLRSNIELGFVFKYSVAFWYGRVLDANRCSLVPCPLIALRCDFSVPKLFAFAPLLLSAALAFLLLAALVLIIWLFCSSACALLLLFVLSCSPALLAWLLLHVLPDFLSQLELWQIWFLFPRGGFMVCWAC